MKVLLLEVILLYIFIMCIFIPYKYLSLVNFPISFGISVILFVYKYLIVCFNIYIF